MKMPMRIQVEEFSEEREWTKMNQMIVRTEVAIIFLNPITRDIPTMVYNTQGISFSLLFVFCFKNLGGHTQPWFKASHQMHNC